MKNEVERAKQQEESVVTQRVDTFEGAGFVISGNGAVGRRDNRKLTS